MEFQRTRPPFKLDACKDGTIYHLHIDFYGKVNQKTAIGECDGGSTDAPRDDSDGRVEDSGDETVVDDADLGENKITDEARSRAWRYWGTDPNATNSDN